MTVPIRENQGNAWSKKSYAQSGEDLIVKFIFDGLRIQRPSYLDIGAHHPFYLSNTALFYELGSRGINIEPDPRLYYAFTEHRKEDKNLNIGISNKKGMQNFFIISTSSLNTFSEKAALSYANEGNFHIQHVVKIPVDNLENIIKKYNDGVFPQFLNIDAEGVDELIIRSINYDNNYPLVICIETISFSTSGNGIKNHDINNFLIEKGYMVYADTNINTILVRKNLWQK